MSMSKKLLVALAVYAGLAVLAWFTLDASISLGERDVPLRAVTLAILGLFAVRTLLHAQAGTDRGIAERVRLLSVRADVAQLVEHSLGKSRRLAGVSEPSAATRERARP